MPISISATWLPPRKDAVTVFAVARQRPSRLPSGEGGPAVSIPALGGSDLEDETEQVNEHPGRGSPDGVVGKLEEPDRKGHGGRVVGRTGRGRHPPRNRPPFLSEQRGLG